MPNVLEVRDLTKVYGGGLAATTTALDKVSFSVAKGELVAIMGPSGSGKSTLLNCVATIDRPTSGEVEVDGHSISTMRQRALADFRRTQLGFIFQDSNLLDTLTCRENIELPLTIDHVKPAQVIERAEKVARSLGVADVLDKYPYQVSGGQAQRIAACRAIVTDPALVLADEPTGALDSKAARVLLEAFQGLNSAYDTTLLMVTHDAYAASFCQRVLFIRDGRLFTVVRRGARSRKEFFDEIGRVVSVIGGADAD